MSRLESDCDNGTNACIIFIGNYLSLGKLLRWEKKRQFDCLTKHHLLSDKKKADGNFRNNQMRKLRNKIMENKMSSDSYFIGFCFYF